MTKNLFQKVGVFAANNASAIYTGAAIVGVGVSVILAVDGTIKAVKVVSEKEEELGRQLSKKEIVKYTWPKYIPTLTTSVMTVTCLVGANRSSARKVAAYASLFSAAEQTMEVYKGKVVEKVGEAVEREIRHDTTKEVIKNNHPVTKTSDLLIIDDGDVLFFETLTNRYFKSTVEKVKKAQNDFNAEILRSEYASMNEWFDLLGLSSTVIGHELGWNHLVKMDIDISAHMSDNGKPCLAIEYNNAPRYDYQR